MVALLVISVGLLGVAKMQALALASTSTSRLRSLAAIQAASLASAMGANRAYWASATLTQPIVVAATTVTTSDANLTSALAVVKAAGTDYCVPGSGAPCAPVTVAAADLQSWATDVNTTLPNSSARITCPPAGIPLTCTILITWAENAVAVNKQAANVTSTTADYRVPTYTLYVQP